MSGIELAQAVDPMVFRRAVGRFASGVTVVTGMHEEAQVGFTCQSFYSVSLEPLLISISVMNSSTSYPRIRESGGFCVNVLSADQSGVSSQFARKGTEKWAGIEWTPTREGLPALDGSLLWIDCRIAAEYPAGDHTIVLGEVREIGESPEADDAPLLFYTGAYRSLADS